MLRVQPPPRRKSPSTSTISSSLSTKKLYLEAYFSRFTLYEITSTWKPANKSTFFSSNNNFVWSIFSCVHASVWKRNPQMEKLSGTLKTSKSSKKKSNSGNPRKCKINRKDELEILFHNSERVLILISRTPAPRSPFSLV